jgi:hypothetical protein
MTLFDPLLDSNTSRLSQVDACFVRVHGILFSGKNKEALVPNMHKYLNLLDAHIAQITKRWLELGQVWTVF